MELCGEHGLYSYPRIGPWAHGECRNGGFPDWLLEKCGKAVRQDAEPYLTYVRRLYGEISRQLEGLLWKDGGPVIGIQLENELLRNAPHIRTLKRLARAAGLEVPIYTMTGWGPAEVPDGEVIPVFGGYPDAFWDRQVSGWARNSRKHYFFSALRDDNTIGADLNQRVDTGDLSYLLKYPYGTCETGGGMQVAYHRRPAIQPDDIAALAMVKVGSGSNIQGYYMYHGGSNPTGQLSPMQESQLTGYHNDLPVIDYDFQAPLGEYGQVRDSYHALRPLHHFLADFGPLLATLPTHLPASTPANLDDRQSLRWAVRSDGRQGFLFINNYQRIEPLPDHPGVQFKLELSEDNLRIPSQPVTIPSGAYLFWPINLDLDGILLKYASAQPVCRIQSGETVYWVFCAHPDIKAEFAFDSQLITDITGTDALLTGEEDTCLLCTPKPGLGGLFSVTSVTGQRANILVLTQDQARRLYKADLWGSQRLLLSSAGLYWAGSELHLQSRQASPPDLAVFPAPAQPLSLGGQPLSYSTRWHLYSLLPAGAIQLLYRSALESSNPPARPARYPWVLSVSPRPPRTRTLTRRKSGRCISPRPAI